MPTLTFRRATEADVAALVDLVTSAYRGDSSRQGWTTEADLLEGQRIDDDLLLADLRAPDSVVLAAHIEGSDHLVDGCVHVRRTGPTTGYLGMFCVRPSGQGQGTGTEIIAEAERFMSAEWGVTTVEMTVLDARTELLAFYERRGYTRTGEHKAFPYGDERFGLPQRDDLRMEILRKTVG